ncbi:MAG: peptidase MA family metallohydrolase [Chloroflexota bacterium]
MRKILIPLLMALCLVSLNVLSVQGQETGIVLKSQEVHNQFPEGIEFEVIAETTPEAQIQEIKLEFKLVGSQRSSYTYLEFTPAVQVDGKYLLHTDGAQYKPPGMLIEYRFVITDSGGCAEETEKQTFLYLDSRFQWEKITDGLVEVYYYGPMQSRAESVLKASTDTIASMGTLLGVAPTRAIRVLGYNSPTEMAAALPFQAEAIATHLITEGQAWYDYGVLLELIGSFEAEGTASHELTHMLVREVFGGAFVNVPIWLNEGLAEYSNANSAFANDPRLSAAAATNQLLPIRHMQSLPGKPQDILLAYAESRSIVTYLIDTYGGEKLRGLLATLKQGAQIDDALKKVYGFDQDGLDNAWRESLNFPLLAEQPAAPSSRWQFGCASRTAQ